MIQSLRIKAATALALCAASFSFAQSAPVFSEDFSGLANGTNLAPSSPGFNYVNATNGIIRITEAGGRTPLLIQSNNAGNTTQGIGVNLPSANAVTSISFSFNLNELTGGTSFRIALGKAADSYYPASGNLPSRLDQFPTPAWETFASQSAFILNMGGNGGLDNNFGMLSSINPAGNAWARVSNDTYLTGTTYNMHLVANSSNDAIVLNGDVIAAGHVAVYIDTVLVSTVAMANNVTPDSFRIYTHGRSAGDGWVASGQFGDFKIWDGATSPIPEPAGITLALAISSLLLFRLVRGRK